MTESRHGGMFTPFIKQCYVTATVCMNVLSNGAAYGFPAILLPQLKLPDSAIPITKSEESWIASIITIAILVGNFSMPTIMNRLGRKRSHFIVMLPTALGWLLIMFATNVQMIIIARCMQGISFGQGVPIRAVIIGEYTSPKNRGAFLSLIAVAQTLGIFTVHLAGSLVSWKNTAAICIIFTTLSFLMTFALPESPSWLASRGRYDECTKHFEWLRGSEENEELNELIEARKNYKITKETSSKKISDVVTHAEFYKPIVITLHMTLLMYVAGSMNLAVYGSTILSEIMGPNVDVHFWLVFLDVVRIITSFFAVFLMRTFKRRTVTFNSIGLCIAVHLAIVAHVSMIKYGIKVLDHVWVPALLLNLQCFSVSSGIVPITSVITGEMFSLEYRTTGISISTAIATAFHFAILKTFPYLVSGVGIEGAYGMYASVLGYCMIVMWYMMPETKGKTLQQIEDRFKGIDKTAAQTELKPLNDIKVVI
ncbi:unnamed protein product [Leptosia nina]|uniref:Major facilitator superfamily (MFS) profile domain-containing protein n=1 Tax=Leptosia nina TaxID=320188 RepID=A0AAV1K374_9NEOP